MSIFAKCHYEAIAQTMQTAWPGAMGENNRAVMQWRETCKDFAEMFERDNPRFQIIRFMRACEPGANVCARGRHSNEPYYAVQALVGGRVWETFFAPYRTAADAVAMRDHLAEKNPACRYQAIRIDVC